MELVAGRKKCHLSSAQTAQQARKQIDAVRLGVNEMLLFNSRGLSHGFSPCQAEEIDRSAESLRHLSHGAHPLQLALDGVVHLVFHGHVRQFDASDFDLGQVRLAQSGLPTE